MHRAISKLYPCVEDSLEISVQFATLARCPPPDGMPTASHCKFHGAHLEAFRACDELQKRKQIASTTPRAGITDLHHNACCWLTVAAHHLRRDKRGDLQDQIFDENRDFSAGVQIMSLVAELPTDLHEQSAEAWYWSTLSLAQHGICRASVDNEAVDDV